MGMSKRLLMWPGFFLAIAMTCCPPRAHAQTIDDLIVSSLESVDGFDPLADLQGNTVRRELDMLLTRDQAEALETESTFGSASLRRKKRKAIRDGRYRWTDKVIPYTIQTGVFSDKDKAQIQAAIDEWQQYTCIRFRPATSSDNNKVHFDNGKGCYSYVGMIRTGSQKIGLAPGCRYKGVIIHEVGHAVGFHHEQNRPDRDDYVRIISENVPSNLLYNFKKYPSSVVDNMDVPYDYGSIMHYGGTAFSMNGQFTIRTLDPAKQGLIGSRTGLSFNDIMLANKMYKCNERCNTNIRCPDGGFLGKDCQCWCPGYPIRRCSATGTQPTTTLKPTQTTTKKPCQDINRNCQFWAKYGYCGKNSYVTTYCKKSCGSCNGQLPTTPSTCTDSREHCSFWGKRGYCDGRFEMFMAENCPKTCKVCGSTNKSPEGNNGTDENKDPNTGSSITGSILASSVSCALFLVSRRVL